MHDFIRVCNTEQKFQNSNVKNDSFGICMKIFFKNNITSFNFVLLWCPIIVTLNFQKKLV